VIFISKESGTGYTNFSLKEYAKFHMSSRKEYEEFLDKKAKRARLIVDSYPDVFD
jgi:hypothetical protein